MTSAVPDSRPAFERRLSLREHQGKLHVTDVTQIRKISIHALGIFVIFPATLAAAFFSLFALAKLLSFIFVERDTSTHDFMMHLRLAVGLALGWAGVITGVKLYSHFLLSDASPSWSGFAWTGLLCGTVTCVGLIYTSGGSLSFRICAMGWPLIGAAVFGWLLLNADSADRHK